MGHQLRQADVQPVWALACQDHISGGYDGVGVVSIVVHSSLLPLWLHLNSGSSLGWVRLVREV